MIDHEDNQPFLSVDPMPIVLQGEGHYKLSDIKNIEVTEEFVGLGQKVTRCQTEEYTEDCILRKLRERALAQCRCAPFNLRSYYGDQIAICSPSQLECIEKVRGWKQYA